MRLVSYLIAAAFVMTPYSAQSQDRPAVTDRFQAWIATSLWPLAQSEGVSRTTFDAALSQVTPKWDLPDLIIPGAPPQTDQFQAEFRAPARYFAGDGLAYGASVGRDLLTRHADILRDIERTTGVPAHIIIAIWGRESSHGQAQIPHDAFQILATKGFLSTRAAYFTDELIAALLMVEQGFATRADMKSSWAGALGQPQFMPSNYLTYAVDGDGDGRADIWGSVPDTLASIGGYLQDHGWQAGRDWGFEVTVPQDLSCALEGPDQGILIRDWVTRGITRVSGAAFPDAEAAEPGYLLMPAGRLGPAFLVTHNFYVLKDYNESDVYALFVGHVGDRMKYGVGGFQGGWAPVDTMSRADVVEIQQALVGLGYDVGGVDGLVGHKTRRSIGAWQAANNTAQTCYPSRAVLAQLRG